MNKQSIEEKIEILETLHSVYCELWGPSSPEAVNCGKRIKALNETWLQIDAHANK